MASDAHPALDAALAALDAPAGEQAPRLLVGLSGGLDSSVLLHALVRRRGPDGLRALHVHHGLHADADAWSAHCERLCAALGVPLQVLRVTVDPQSPLGPEGAAREARHAAFRQALAPGESLVLAHHRADQAETVLLRLLRASGTGGVAGMRAERRIGESRLLRPLLGVGREVLLDYARSQALAWCEDPSNAREDADRNFLRLRVLPLLRERWPQTEAALAASGAHLAQEAQLLREAAGERLDALCDGGEGLPVEALRALSPGWRAQVLRAWVESVGFPPLPGAAPATVAREVLDAPHDRPACYRWQDVELRRWGDRLLARHVATPAPDWAPLAWDGRAPLPLPDGGRLWLEGAGGDGLDEAFGACRVGPRAGGERIRLSGREHSHALKDRLRESGLPPWQRAGLPVLSAGDGECLAAGDRVVSARLQAWLAARGARLCWQPPPTGRQAD